MKITHNMSIADLAERMGPDATTEEADIMRDLLNDSGCDTTESVPESEWIDMLLTVCDRMEREST